MGPPAINPRSCADLPPSKSWATVTMIVTVVSCAVIMTVVAIVGWARCSPTRGPGVSDNLSLASDNQGGQSD
jgi:hypothetical protein